MRWTLSVLGLLGFLLTTGPLAAAEKTLATYDLGYTLKLDLQNPQQLRRIWDETHFVASLQGIVNRQQPELYLYLVGSGEGGLDVDRYWLEKFRGKDGWLAQYTLSPVPDLPQLIRRFRSKIQGLVVYDEKVAATSNIASTIAGVEDLACVRYDTDPASLFQWLTADPKGPQLAVKVWLLNPDGSSLFTGKGTLPGSNTPSTGSTKCDAYLWAKEKYLDTGRCNATKMAFYQDAYWLRNPGGHVNHTCLVNHDYFISQKAFFFDLSPWGDEAPVDDPQQTLGTDVTTLKALLRSAYDQTHGKAMIHAGGFIPWNKKYCDYPGANGKHGAVDAEWEYASILSCFNAFMDADALGCNAMANASVNQHYRLANRYPQRKPTVDDLRRRGFLQENGRVAPKTFVAIYVGDYDSAAWLYQNMPRLWDDPARGQVPLGWAFNPNLADRFGPGMAYLRATATENDSFVAGDCGAGYLNPGNLLAPRKHSGLPSGMDVWAEHCARAYRQWDLSITGFIIDGFAAPTTDKVLEYYSHFSGDGVGLQRGARTGMVNSMPYVTHMCDLGGPPEKDAQTIVAHAKQKAAPFLMYRTILWSPTDQKTSRRGGQGQPRRRPDRVRRTAQLLPPHADCRWREIAANGTSGLRYRRPVLCKESLRLLC